MFGAKAHMQFSLKQNLHPVIIPFVLLLITGAIIIGCHIITPTDNADYHAILLEKMEYAKTFSDFTNALFCYEATTDSITTAYTLKNPADYSECKIAPNSPQAIQQKNSEAYGH